MGIELTTSKNLQIVGLESGTCGPNSDSYSRTVPRQGEIAMLPTDHKTKLEKLYDHHKTSPTKAFIMNCKTLDCRYAPFYVYKYNIFSQEELAREVSIWWPSGSQGVAKR